MSFLSQLSHHTIPTLIALIKRLNPCCWDLLKPHANKVISFHIEHLPILCFQMTEEDLVYLPDPPQHIDTTFSGTISTLLSTLLNQQHKTSLHVRGDMECAKALFDAWQNFDIDWEGHLAAQVGDTLAHGVAQSLHQGKMWAQETWQNRQEDLSAYLQDEIQLLPTQGEVDALMSDIDTLRHDVARFEAKLHLFAKRCTSEG